MGLTHVLALGLCVASSSSQTIQGLGSSGGNGPKGGIGDLSHPVMNAQSFVTDALIPLKPNTTRQLAKGNPPLLTEHPSNATKACPSPRRVVIDDAKGARQEMLGFGFAWTDSTVDVLNSLQPDLFDQVMHELFSQDGNNMGMMRHTIGSSDLSYRQYSFDDNGPNFNDGAPDLNLDHFSLGTDGTAMVELIAKMGSYKGDVFLFGAPWSYPGWMKHNGLFVAPDLGYNVMNNSFDEQYIPTAVKYFQKYLDAYRDHGVTVNGLSLMNEPLNYQGGTTTMYLEAADAAAILEQGLGSILKERGVIVMAYDHNTDQPVYPSQVVQKAPGLVGAAAWHCYASNANYSVLDDFHYAYSDKPQFMTECSSYLPQTGTVDWQVVNAFMPAIQHGASGANMWVLATNPEYGPHSPYGGCAGCEGAIIVNSSTSYTKTQNYYMVGQFSRFIRRGAIAHKIIQGNEGNHLTPNQFNGFAARNPDGSWAVVFVNNLNRTENVRLEFTGSSHVWEGQVPNSTTTTWLIPSDRYINQTANTTSSSMPYALNNGTAAGRKANATCQLPPATTTMTSDSSGPSLPPPIPIPYPDHVVEQNVLHDEM